MDDLFRCSRVLGMFAKTLLVWCVPVYSLAFFARADFLAAMRMYEFPGI